MKKNKGFTLIEVIMVVFILGIVVVVGGNLFFSVLKGASKTEVIKEVKQNGDYAIGVMERMIRNAQSIQTCAANNIVIKNLDGGQTDFKCLSEGGVTKIASGSAGLTGNLTGNNVTLTASGGTNCPGTLSFTCDQTVTPPKATISFTLYQKGTSTRPEEQAQVSFQTTVGLRTY